MKDATRVFGSYSKSSYSMKRELVHGHTAVMYCGFFLFTAVGKLYSLYAMKYYNDNKYPVPPTVLVASAEVAKLVTMATVMAFQGNLRKTELSLQFALPAFLYGATNNINVYALNYTSPPVWAVLIQMRLIFAALTYRLIFKHRITKTQWSAILLLICGIIVIKSSGDSLSGIYIHPAAVLLAAVKSIVCVAAAILTECFFKNDNRSFVEQQLQLYFFGTLVTSLFGAMELTSVSSIWPKFHSEANGPFVISTLMFLYILLSVLTGVSVAVVMKKLDNIVKLYVGVLSTLITTVISSVFFSEVFRISAHFVAGFLLVCGAIFLYENPDIHGVFGGWETFAMYVETRGQITKRIAVCMVSLFIFLNLVFAYLELKYDLLWRLMSKH